MLSYPNIDPVAFQIGSLSIYWYGITYLIGFLAAYILCIVRGSSKTPPWTNEEVSDLIFYCAIGVVFGGTIGNYLFYDFSGFLEDPLKIFKFWEPGRSFHGGLLGVILAVYLFCRRYKRRFLEVSDFLAPVVPIGLGAGRIGNFINGELWGRVTDVPWGMVFPHAGNLPRHPSQLYEFFLEGILLFTILMIYDRKPRPTGSVFGLFLLGYGVFRILVEFVREPDPGKLFIAFDWITMGQLLSFPMVIIGLALMLYSKHNQERRGV